MSAAGCPSLCSAVPGGEMNTEAITAHGNSFTAKGPHGDVIAHIAGIDLPDGTHHGTQAFIDDPQIAAAVCDALT